MAEELKDFDEELQSGKYLFKYCKFDVNALQIIINKTLYFCSPDKLNDPLDSNFDIEITNPNNFKEKTRDNIKYSGFPLSEDVKLLLKDYGSVMGNVKSQKKLFEGYFKYMQNTFLGICSFSTKIKDGNLLWSHYANEAKGLCLVFDKEKLVESLSQKLGLSYRILKGNIDYDGIKPLLVKITEDNDLEYSFSHLFSKTKHWSSEEEYRIVLEKYESSPFDFGFSMFYPFLKFDDSCLEFIIWGERILEEHSQLLLKLKDEHVFAAELLNHEFDR